MEKYFDSFGNELYKCIADGTDIAFYTNTNYVWFPVAGAEFRNAALRSAFCKQVVDNTKPMFKQSFLINSETQSYYLSSHLPIGTDANNNLLIVDFQCNYKHTKGYYYVEPDTTTPDLNTVSNNFNNEKLTIIDPAGWQGLNTKDALYIVLAQYGLIFFDTSGNQLGTTYCVIGYYINNKGEQIGHNQAAYGFRERYFGTGLNMHWQGYTLNPTTVKREADNTNNTETGGGYGSGSNPTDDINIPALPNVTITNTGVCLYGLTSTQVQAFTGWLWTSDWQDNIKKIQTDPMQNIIGISLIDYPVSGTSSTIQVGNLNTSVNANIVNNWLTVDCGSITLEEYYGSFADYEPFIATTLYLPKVGFVQIPADTIINNSIKIVYNIELISGEGLCYVYITDNRNGFSYVFNTYTCHATANIPTSASDHTQQLTALINAGINSTVAIGGAIATSGATAGSALSTVASSALNVATTKNPTVTRGNFGNFGNILCYKKPYIIINRTNLTKPSSFQENNGYLINYTAKIQGHTGYLKTRDYHCEFNAPYNHRAEIERLLDSGVIING